MNKKVLSLLVLLSIAVTACFASEFKTKTLPSGQNVIIKEVKRNPIVTIDTWIKTGSIDENEKNSGVAHFLEHLFFKGTQNNPTGVFDKKIESRGGVTNAATSKDFTHYYITIPSEYFEEALDLHADMLLNPMIPRKEFEKERSVVIEEISKGKDAPYRIMYENGAKLLYKGHPYERPVIGNENIIQNITREEILNFYAENYNPSEMTTVIVGDVDSAHAMKLVENYFKRDEEGKKSKKQYPKIQPPKKQERITDKQNVELGYMSIVYPVPKNISKKEIFALDVLSEILGGYKSSRLNRIKEDKELVNSISSGYEMMREGGSFNIISTFKPQNAELVEGEIYEEIENIKQNGITKDELNKTKNYIKTESYYERESNENIADTIGYLSIFYKGTGFYENYVNNIEKVSVNDVKRVANKYLINDRNVVSTILPLNFEEKDILKYQKDETEIAQNKEQVQLKKVNLYGQTPKYEILDKNSNTVKYKLENGMIVIIRKNTDNSIIAMNIKSLYDAKNTKIALTNLASLTVKDGTKSYSRDDISRFLDERGIKLSYSSSPDGFSIGLITTKNELEDALTLLYETANNAVFNEKDIEKNRAQIKLQLANVKDDPIALGTDNFKKEAFQGTIYGNTSQIVLENIDKVNKQDIVDFYANIFSPQNMVVSIVGDVDESKMLSSLNSIFKGESKNKIELTKIKDEKYRPKENVEKAVKKQNVNTSWLFLGYKTCSMFNTKDRAVLQIIDAILGNGMSSRLFKSLRENQGLAYAVGSSISQFYLDGVFMTYIGTNPENIEISKKGMLDEINTIKTEYVTKEELQYAKDKIMGQLLLSLETNSDEAALLNVYGVFNRSVDYLKEYEELIKSTTQNDVLTVANKYFNKPYVFVVIEP